MIRSIALVFCALLIGGCSSKPAPTNTPFSVESRWVIGDQVNPYGGVDHHPIVLRLYQLREPGAFNNAEFLDIYLDDRKALGASLIDAQYLQPMLPGEQTLALDIQRDSRYLAVFAEFADYKSAVGKALLKLDDNPDLQVITVNVNALVVELSAKAKKKKGWW
ncbi:MAG: type VI secretion system lipoprotein TssJ [Pseudomonadales bacterium]